MIQSKIIKELMKRLDISRIGVYKKIERIQKDLKIIDNEVAAYCLAFQNDIKLSKYNIDEKILEKVENALRNSSSSTQEKKIKHKNMDSRVSQKFVLNVNNEIIEHPLLSKTMVKEAEKMSEVYPIFYIFENSVRRLIEHVELKKHGKDWWVKSTIPSKVKNKVEIRIKDENKNKWHGKRGAHPIFYTDIEELVSIIENNWEDFENLLPKQHWVRTIIEIIGTSRNIVAHNNPLSNDDISALKVHFKQWTNQINAIKIN